MPYYERDATGALVPTREVPDEAILAIERADEDAIVQRLTTGIGSSAFLYSYPISTREGKREIIGLSAEGAYEIAAQLGNIEVLHPISVDKDSDPDYFYAMVRAKDLIRNLTLLGVGRHCKYMIGKGNQPDHDRPNEHAFVSSISKAQRNAILHLAPQEAIIRIIDSFDKRGGRKTLKPPTIETEAEVAKPPVAGPPAAITPEQIETQQEKLKQLRIQVHNKFRVELGIDEAKRKPMLKEKFGKESLTELKEQQLNECFSLIEGLIAKAGVKAPEKTKDEVAKGLGFESAAEQTKLRGTFYTMLTSKDQLGLTEDEARTFIGDRKVASTAVITKAILVTLIDEANKLIEVKKLSESEVVPEELPF